MPELPEVETVRTGLAPHLVGQRMLAVRIHEPRLRWPVDPGMAAALRDRTIVSVGRRSKYLLVGFAGETLLVHLGMSGSLRLARPEEPRRRHDHVEFLLDSGAVLRFHDPRRVRYERLAQAVKLVLANAIEQGGTTLRDFVNGNGSPGYFARRLAVYGRDGQPCRTCGSRIRTRRLGQRSTFWCPVCQRP